MTTQFQLRIVGRDLREVWSMSESSSWKPKQRVTGVTFKFANTPKLSGLPPADRSSNVCSTQQGTEYIKHHVNDNCVSDSNVQQRCYCGPGGKPFEEYKRARTKIPAETSLRMGVLGMDNRQGRGGTVVHFQRQQRQQRQWYIPKQLSLSKLSHAASGMWSDPWAMFELSRGAAAMLLRWTSPDFKEEIASTNINGRPCTSRSDKDEWITLESPAMNWNETFFLSFFLILWEDDFVDRSSTDPCGHMSSPSAVTVATHDIRKGWHRM